ncbi:5-oxoprolinase subunit PxpB [Pusillimonas sp. ANT_WB101]|uniref:5-oxoprolinase subunit PxpB n=1 Tax=Pusillimonas sp. ANT_WB101 TaxID=2597356 RepID=UPI0011EDE722|nr:5-oxoprolinase subunit PxpB [Pusillimonas sp. ANT_WB101]KAA0890692.1 5-oxoprolinase subunit PxpB [Pusillimonas sp. ANT_WB101]
MPAATKHACPPWALAPQGDRCLILTFGETIDVAVGKRCAAAAWALRQANLLGVTDIVPAFTTLAVHYQPQVADRGNSLSRLASEIEQVLASELADQTTATHGKQVDIPVCYGAEYGPDLADVAAHTGLSTDEVIRLHSAEPCYVFMLGFAPGAPYLGVHDVRLDIGRRPTPRTRLPAGSVAIANRQTMIYPNASPGGWHIIGATPVTLFNPVENPPTLLSPGDMLRFIPVSAEEFLAIKGGQS